MGQQDIEGEALRELAKLLAVGRADELGQALVPRGDLGLLGDLGADRGAMCARGVVDSQLRGDLGESVLQLVDGGLRGRALLAGLGVIEGRRIVAAVGFALSPPLVDDRPRAVEIAAQAVALRDGGLEPAAAARDQGAQLGFGDVALATR